jgi:hypothetical protein
MRGVLGIAVILALAGVFFPPGAHAQCAGPDRGEESVKYDDILDKDFDNGCFAVCAVDGGDEGQGELITVPLEPGKSAEASCPEESIYAGYKSRIEYFPGAEPLPGR